MSGQSKEDSMIEPTDEWENEKEFFVKYRFIHDDIRLGARVMKEDGKQYLIISKIDTQTGIPIKEFKLNCIHTAIKNITAEEFHSLENDVEAQEKFYNNMSTEGMDNTLLQDIALDLSVKFFVFKSWVAGIAEYGIKSIKLQSELENLAKFQYPVSHFLLKSLIQIDKELIIPYLDYIEKSCRFEGELHEASILSNVMLIFKSSNKNNEEIDFIINNLRDFYPDIYKLLPKLSDPFIHWVLKHDLDEEYEELVKDIDEINRNINNGNIKIKFNENLGIYYSNTSKMKISIKIFKDLVNWHEKLNDLPKRSVLLYRLGVLYELRGDTRLALNSYLESCDYAMEYGLLDVKKAVFMALGYLYEKLGNLNSAILYFDMLANHCKRTNDYSDIQVIQYKRAMISAKMAVKLDKNMQIEEAITKYRESSRLLFELIKVSDNKDSIQKYACKIEEYYARADELEKD